MAGLGKLRTTFMRKIYSSSTFLMKRVFPVVWFGFVTFFLVMAIQGHIRGGAPIFIVIVPLFMLVIGYVVMKMLVFDLMDEVYLSDGDEQVVVRNRGEEDRFPVTNILNVDSSTMANPERITLTLRQPCKFGDSVTFSPPKRWWPFTRNPLALELIRLAHGIEQGQQDR
jgi:hypothetical protein